MKRVESSDKTDYWGVALRGAVLALAVTLGYALIFWMYAVVRASLTLWDTVNESAGMVGTWLATASALAIATLTIAAIFSLLVIPLGAAAAVAIVWVSEHWNRTARPSVAVVIGALVTGFVAVLFFALIQLAGLQIAWRYWEAWSLWLVVPLVLFVLAGGAASWEWNRERSLNPRVLSAIPVHV